jgi:starvation-inducible outer membrane lipoprotein
MLRWLTIATVSLMMTGCSTPSKPLQERIPASLNGWTRTEAAALDPASTPDIVKQLGLKSAVSATYTGPAAVRVRIFEMNVSTSAFELIQKWRQQDGLAVYNGPYFIVAEPQSPPQAPALLESLRKQLE